MKRSAPTPRVLLIGGLSRSGTSMLQKLCNSHPEISVTYEFKSFLDLGRRLPGYIRTLRIPSTTRNRFSDLVFFGRYLLLLLPRGFRKVRLEDVRHALHVIFPQASIVGDKFPRYLWHLDKLTGYEGIHLVIIYRDGRDVAQSIFRKTQTAWKNKDWAKRSLDTFTKIAVRWVRSIEFMEKHASHIHIIRYEDMVAHPDQELDRLAAILGVDPAGFQSNMVHSSSVGKYQRKLTDEQIAEFTAVAGPTLRRLGYLDGREITAEE